MATLRITNAQIVHTYTAGALINGPDSVTLTRLDNGKMVAAWDTVSGASELLNFSVLSTLGVTPSPVVTADTVAASSYLEHPRFASTTSGGFFSVWGSDLDNEALTSGDTFGRLFTAAGAASGAKFALSTAPAGGEGSASVTRLGNGNFLATWSDTLGSSGLGITSDIQARLYSPAGTAIGGEFTLNQVTSGAQFGTDVVTLGSGNAVAVWATGNFTFAGLQATGMKGRIINANATLAPVEFSVDTISAGAEYEAKALDVLALGNGGFVVVWEEDNGATEQIHFQRFTATGAKAGGEVTIEDTGANRNVYYLMPVELAHGGFAVGWMQIGGGQPNTTHIRQFNMNGVEIGTEERLDTIAGSLGLNMIFDLELMQDGRVMALGHRGTTAVATQVFDLGSKSLVGTNATDALYGKDGVNDLIFGLAGNDSLFGLSGNDIVDGSAGLDRIIAGAGNDVIRGGADADTLTGGTGLDTFVFNTLPNTSTNRDTITDFVAADDTVQLENAIFTALGASVGRLAASQFWASATGTAHDADDRIVYNTVTGNLGYDANGNAAGGLVIFATLSTKPTITAADFVVI